MQEMTKKDWETLRYFEEAEFKCKHCGQVHIDAAFIKKLHYARAISRWPYVINSGYRCPAYDKEIGGKGNHPTGRAADIAVGSSRARYKILEGLFAQRFTRIGIGKNFIHVDALEHIKDPEVMWLYE